MMRYCRSVFVILLTLCFNGRVEARKFPGRIFVTPEIGIMKGGLLSDGSPLSGNVFGLNLGWLPAPERKIGIQFSAGIGARSHRQDFDETIFIWHLQRGLTAEVNAYVYLHERVRALVGIYFFTPLYREVALGVKQYHATNYFGNNFLNAPYNATLLQAGASLALDCALGSKKQSRLGIKVVQMANSPVKQEVEYTDGAGHYVTVTRGLKPLYVEVYFAVDVIGRKERKEKDNDQ